MCAFESTATHVPSDFITASTHVFPPSVDTCTFSPVARAAVRWPLSKRPAVPSFVNRSKLKLPLSRPISSRIACVVGVNGATGPIVTSKPADTTLVLPAGSIAVTVSECVPFDNPDGSLNVHAPSMPVVAVPSTFVPSYTVTVEYASARPDSVGCAPSVAASIVGRDGGVVSTTIPYDVDGTLHPASLLARAVSRYSPSLSDCGNAKLHVPFAFTTAVPTSRPSTST
ncbi:hypothetical protein WJ42_03470 [Burkholderia cepacia]|nr:hypothetical protein WJ42_03470 [Burkholderia cepacia]KWC63510.1 hypothetical protein WL55_26905 [Burkholderia cepacia]